MAPKCHGYPACEILVLIQSTIVSIYRMASISAFVFGLNNLASNAPVRSLSSGSSVFSHALSQSTESCGEAARYTWQVFGSVTVNKTGLMGQRD